MGVMIFHLMDTPFLILLISFPILLRSSIFLQNVHRVCKCQETAMSEILLLKLWSKDYVHLDFLGSLAIQSRITIPGQPNWNLSYNSII